jgi:very-short-patch-repair endonuclease
MAKAGMVVGQKVARTKVQRAKDLRRDMTPSEARLWQRLRRNQLGGLHFRRQQIIDGFIADFYCHAAGVVIELDGPIHERQADYDRERDRVIAARDLLVIRIRNAEIDTDLDLLLARIHAACRDRMAALTTVPGQRHPLPASGRGTKG